MTENLKSKERIKEEKENGKLVVPKRERGYKNNRNTKPKKEEENTERKPRNNNRVKNENKSIVFEF